MDKSAFEFPQTWKEKIGQYGLLSILGISGLFVLKWLLPVVNGVLGGLVEGFQLLIKAGLLAAILTTMVIMQPVFMRVIRVLAKKIAIKWMRLMPVEHIELVYDGQRQKAEKVGEVHRLIRGRVNALTEKIKEYLKKKEAAEQLSIQAHKIGDDASHRAQAGIAKDRARAIEEYQDQREKLSQFEVMLSKAYQVAQAVMQRLSVRKEIAADQWEQAKANAEANESLVGLFGRNSKQMQIFDDAERYIKDECAATFGELDAIFDQASDIIGQFELEQGAASDEVLEKFGRRVLALEHKSPAPLVSMDVDNASPVAVSASGDDAALDFLPSRRDDRR